jgi:hypothetical protein
MCQVLPACTPLVDSHGAETDIVGMNVFAALVPDQSAGAGPFFDVNLYQAPDGTAWIAECDAIPIATEAPTIDALIDRVWEVAPEVAAPNGHKGSLRLRFLLHTSALT